LPGLFRDEITELDTAIRAHRIKDEPFIRVVRTDYPMPDLAIAIRESGCASWMTGEALSSLEVFLSANIRGPMPRSGTG
jgi:hypothetical protein